MQLKSSNNHYLGGSGLYPPPSPGPTTVSPLLGTRRHALPRIRLYALPGEEPERTVGVKEEEMDRWD